MTVQFTTGIYFALGAFFFFGAGFFLAIQWLNFNKSKLKDEIKRAKQREEAVLEKSLEESSILKYHLDILKQKSGEYRNATQKRMVELNNRAMNLNSTLEEYKKRLSQLTAEHTQIQSENALLVKALKTAKNDLRRISSLEQKNYEQTKALDLLSVKLKYFDQLKGENKRLAFKLLEQQIPKTQVQSMKAEKAFPSKASLSDTDNFLFTGSFRTEGLGESFQSIVNQISQVDGSLAVAIADELGLLIAGTGDHMDSMAAMAAVYGEVARKVTSLIPFGSINTVKIRSLENLTINMQSFEVDSEKLILTALTAEKEPYRNSFDQFAQQLITLYSRSA